MSRDKKISLIGFDTFETDAFETYLEKMAKKGWLLEKYESFMTFRKIEPQALKFHIEPIPGASIFDSDASFPSSTEETSAEDFPRWKKCCSNNFFLIYYAERDLPPEKEFLDREARFRALAGPFIRRQAPVYIFLILFLMAGTIFLIRSAGLSDSLVILALADIFFIVLFLRPLIWYFRGKHALRHDKPLPSSSYGMKRLWNCFSMGCALALILFYLYRDFFEEGSLRTILTFLSSLGLSAICVGLTVFIRSAEDISRGGKKLAYIMAVIIVGGIYFLVVNQIFGI